MSVCSCMKGRPHSTCGHIHVCRKTVACAKSHTAWGEPRSFSRGGMRKQHYPLKQKKLPPETMAALSLKQQQPQRQTTPEAKRDNSRGRKGQPHGQKGKTPQAERTNPTGRKGQLHGKKGQPHGQKGTTPEAERDNCRGRKGQPHGQKGTTPWAERDNPMGRKG